MDGKDVLIGYSNPQYDRHAKRILAHKKIMAYILKRTVPEFKDASLDDIADIYIEGEPAVGTVPVNPDKTNTACIRGDRNESVSATEGWITYDILFRARVPDTEERITLIINVEAQKTQDKNHLGYHLLNRAVYYAARLISSQKETEFTGSAYDDIKKVYSIFICMDSPNGKNAINRYEMKEQHLFHRYAADKKNYDLISVVMIYLAEGRAQDRLISLLQLLFEETKLSGAEREEALHKKYQIHLTTEMREELNTMCNLSEGIVDRTTERVTKSMFTENVKSLVEATGWSLDKAMDTLKVPTDMRPAVVKALSSS